MSQVNERLFQHDGDRSLNAVSPDKNSASGVRQADVPTSFNPISPRQNICSSKTKKNG